MDTQNQHKEHWLNLIIDRLTGTISEDSDLCLQEWIHASDENSRYFKNMELLWHSMEVVHEGEQYDSDRAFLLFKQRIETENTINTRKSFTLKKVLSYAAILISFITLNCLIHQYYIHPSDQNILRLSEIAVPNGSKTKLTLQDGTKVWLNAQSTLTYSHDFGRNKRNVELDGGAYFEAAKNKEIPFYVNTETNQVRVVETHFNVCAYRGSNEFTTTLLEGIVDIYAKGSEHSLTRLGVNEVFIFWDGKFRKERFTDFDYLRWKDGLYCFDDTPFNLLLGTFSCNRNFIYFMHFSGDGISFLLCLYFKRQ